MKSCFDCRHFVSGADRCTYYDSGIWEEPCHTYYYNYGNASATECPGYSEKSYYGGSSGSSSDGCFLTSACVNHLGKSDDCEELTTLRAFRDNYMKTTPQGQALVKEYYAVAPQIVANIDKSADSDSTYDYIYGVITDCIALIKGGDNQGAQNRYCDMVNTLKTKFGA